MVSARRIVRRYLIGKFLSRQKVAINLDIPTPLVWFENEAGETFDVHFNSDGPPDTPPSGFVYQHSRFPGSLVETILRIVTQEDIDTCFHQEVMTDHGLIEGLEGRICRGCGGRQVRDVGAPWPDKWDGAGSSRPMMTMNAGFSEALVLAMVRPSAFEVTIAAQRGHTIQPVSFERAVILAATACERCLNVLLYRHGLHDGYEEGSEEWSRSNTRCKMCE